MNIQYSELSFMESFRVIIELSFIGEKKVYFKKAAGVVLRKLISRSVLKMNY